MVMTELIRDSGGAGQWDAVPACKFVFTPRQLPVMAAYSCDGIENVPKGACGGSLGGPPPSGSTASTRVRHRASTCLAFDNPVIEFGEALVSECSSAGGYGDPLERDPDLVRHRAREGWISSERASDVYGVVLDLTPELYAVDEEATERLRAEKRSARAASRRVDKIGAGVRSQWLSMSVSMWEGHSPTPSFSTRRAA